MFGQGLKQLFNWQKGDVLGIYSPNDIDIPIVVAGMLWAGGVVCPANPTYTVTELARQLEDSNAKVLVTQKALLSVACEAAMRVGMPLRNVVLIGDRQNQYKHWTEVVAHRANGPLPTKTPLDPKHDLAYLMYSSVSEINVNVPECIFTMSRFRGLPVCPKV